MEETSPLDRGTRRAPEIPASEEPVRNAISRVTWSPGRMHLFAHLKPGFTFSRAVNHRKVGLIAIFSNEEEEEEEEEGEGTQVTRITCAISWVSWSPARLASRCLDLSNDRFTRRRIRIVGRIVRWADSRSVETFLLGKRQTFRVVFPFQGEKSVRCSRKFGVIYPMIFHALIKRNFFKGARVQL